jgi:hypothetical protein
LTSEEWESSGFERCVAAPAPALTPTGAATVTGIPVEIIWLSR